MAQGMAVVQEFPPSGLAQVTGNNLGLDPDSAFDQLADNADVIAAVLLGSNAIAAFLNRIPKVGPILSRVALPGLAAAVKLSKSKIQEMNAEARANRDYLTATLTQFRLDLDQGVEDNLFVKSLK